MSNNNRINRTNKDKISFLKYFLALLTFLVILLPIDAQAKKTVFGKIYDNDNHAVVGALVYAYDSDIGNDDYMGSSRTDKEGKYTIHYGNKSGNKKWDGGLGSAFRPDIYIKVFDGGRSFGRSKIYNNWDMDANLPISMKIPGVRQITGNVIDNFGKPVPNAIVIAFDSDMGNPIGDIFNALAFIARFYPPLYAASLATATANVANMKNALPTFTVEQRVEIEQKKILKNTIDGISKALGKSGSDDYMGISETDSKGKFTIAYRGGHWDPAKHGNTVWRPDIYVRIFKTENNKLIELARSKVVNNHKLSDKIAFNNLKVFYIGTH